MKQITENMEIQYRRASSGDAQELTRLFWGHIRANPEYISHGEVQMGVARDTETPAADGREKWETYIRSILAGEDSRVYVARRNGMVVGFSIVLVTDDNDKPFGVLNDILVVPEYRKRGIGSVLLRQSLAWLRERAVESCYLESGRNNHPAHGFFEKKGFRMASHTYYMNINPASGIDVPDAQTE